VWPKRREQNNIGCRCDGTDYIYQYGPLEISHLRAATVCVVRHSDAPEGRGGNAVRVCRVDSAAVHV